MNLLKLVIYLLTYIHWLRIV
jgi:pyruvate dehydrogenase phosphatase regulatory subunit